MEEKNVVLLVSLSNCPNAFFAKNQGQIKRFDAVEREFEP